MKKFVYEAFDNHGLFFKNTIEASSESQVAEFVRSNGFFVTNIKAVEDEKSSKVPSCRQSDNRLYVAHAFGILIGILIAILIFVCFAVVER